MNRKPIAGLNTDYDREANPDNVWWVDDQNMFLQNTPWDKDNGKHDALFRTGFAYAVYGEKVLRDGIMSCMNIGVFWFFDEEFLVPYRYPAVGYQLTTSRDQLSGAIIGLAINGDWDKIQWICDNLKWKISDKFNQTIDFYLWQKSMNESNNRKLYGLLFHLVSLVMVSLVLPWNAFIRFIGGYKSVNQDDFKSESPDTLSRATKVMNKMMYPTFAFFIWVWQVYVSPNSIIKRPLQLLMRLECEKSNYVLRMLLGDKNIYLDQITDYKSMHGLRWNNRLDKSTNDGMWTLSDDEKKFNDLDSDMLRWCYLNT
jgi:hypothetical protein